MNNTPSAARDEALRAFRESQQHATGFNPYTIFLQGWDARQAELDGAAPKAFPATVELRSSGWSRAAIV